MATFNEKSSFTADGVAYRRIFTDIPLSKEIWKIVESANGKGQLSPEDLKMMQNRPMLSFFEARYLMTDRELAKSGIRQVLELAPGLSSRGITMTQSSEVTYVELDLPEKMEQKRAVVRALEQDKIIKPVSNLFLESGNVIDKTDFSRAVSHFDLNKPIAVICEGLLRYLSFSDKEILGRMIRDMLLKTSGVWITPDIEFVGEMRPHVPGSSQYQQMAQRGIDVRSNIFQDKAHSLSFFENLGFSIITYPLSEMIDSLASPKKAGLAPEETAAPIRNRWLYVMKPKRQCKRFDI